MTVKGTGLAVRVEYCGQVVALHERSYAKDETRFQRPLHPAFGAKATGGEKCPPGQTSQPPGRNLSFGGPAARGNHDLVKILRLIVDCGVEPVRQAVRQAINNRQYNIESVLFTYKPAGGNICPTPRIFA